MRTITKPKYHNSSRSKLIGILLSLMLMFTMMPFVGSAADGFDDLDAEDEGIEQIDGSGSEDPDGDLGDDPDGDDPDGDDPDGDDPDGDENGSNENPPSTDPPIINNPLLGSIAGFLWIDGNGMKSTDWDGLFNGSEGPLAVFTVSLYAADDLTTPIATTVTKSDGTYAFSDLEPGDYVLGLASGKVSGKEYLVPMMATAENKFAIDFSTFADAYTEVISVEAGVAITGINAGMRLPMGIQPTAFAATIDLSETTTGDSALGYTISSGMNPYSVQYPGSVGSAVTTGSGDFRTLTFTANANGREFLIVQSGRRTTPVDGEPKYQTAIFNSIIIEPGVNVTLVIESIDLIGNIDVKIPGNLTLLLATDKTFLPTTNTIGSFVHGSIIVPATAAGNRATITIDDFDASGGSNSALKVLDVQATYAGIGGFNPSSGGTDTTNARAGNIIINGGKITVDLCNQASRSAAAIGGGLFVPAGNITINGGTVYASSNNTAAAIGGGQDGQGGTIIINGGNVTAECKFSTNTSAGSPSGAAIGSGSSSGAINFVANAGTITINGGVVNALGEGQGAAIGGGSRYNAGTITITGGTINAHSRFSPGGGAGIGGGQGGGGGTIAITGGTVVASSVAGAGIGGGFLNSVDSRTPATINIGIGANIKAYSYGPTSRPAIDANGPNQGNGYYVNALLNESPGTTPMDILVFPHGYTGGNPAAAVNVLTLPVTPYHLTTPTPKTYMRFAYTTNATATQNDNLYINLGYSDYLGATEYRVIDRVFDSNKQIPSVNNLTSYNPYNGNAANGVLPVKIRALAVAGTPSSNNIGKYDADLISQDHSLGISTFVDGGFRFSTTVGANGRPATPVSMSWELASFLSTPITKNTMTRIAADPKLAPNTKYYVITYLTVNADYWLTPVGPSDFTFESATVHEFVTLPNITSGSARPVGSGEALVSATFEGGTQPLRVWIYWDTNPIDPLDPASWSAHSVKELVFDDGVTPGGEFTYAGFTDISITGLTPGSDYNFLVVSQNVTGYAYYAIAYADLVDFIFFKVNEADAPMAGVSFSLYSCTDSDPATHVHPPLVTGATGECWGNPVTVLSDANGRVAFLGLAEGSYMLVENFTHAGYQLPMGQWLIEVDASLAITITAHSVDIGTIPPAFKTAANGDLQLPNYPQMIVPLSGGVGLAVTTTLGLVLLGDALIFAMLGRRRKRLLEAG